MRINYLNYSGKLNINYSKNYPLAFSPHQKIKFTALYDMLHIQTDLPKSKKYLSFGTNFLFHQNLGKETYLSTSGLIRRGLWNRKPRRILNTETKGTVFNFHSFKQTVQNFNQINLKLQKVLNQSLYPIYFPLALSRWAPLANVSLVAFEDKELSTEGYHYLLSTL